MPKTQECFRLFATFIRQRSALSRLNKNVRPKLNCIKFPWNFETNFGHSIKMTEEKKTDITNKEDSWYQKVKKKKILFQTFMVIKI